MEVPKTYIGTDAEGQQICSVKAVDANDYINPAEVQAAIEKIKTVVKDEMQNIINGMSNIIIDADEAIIVEGTKMTQTIQDVCTELKKLPDSFIDSISGIYDESIKAHDALQKEENDKAYNAAASAASAAGGSAREA